MRKRGEDASESELMSGLPLWATGLNSTGVPLEKDTECSLELLSSHLCLLGGPSWDPQLLSKPPSPI